MRSLAAYFRYTAGTLFAGKFLYFFSLAVVMFLVVVIVFVVNHDEPPSARHVYNFLLVPGLLLVFYPSSYSIQGDADARVLETLFGIPDYRYKVWLARFVVWNISIGLFLFILALLSRLALADFPLFDMIFHVMFPVVFLGAFGFMLASVTRSGNSTAVLMVLSILVCWFTSGILEGSGWDLFHNPYAVAGESDMLYWPEVTLYSRIYLAIGALLSTMFGLLRLQYREKFF